jgi:uncharacterized protein
VAVICPPNPQAGGTLDNKVVQTLMRAFVQLNHKSVCFNFRGVGASEGVWDQGVGEVDDALAVIDAQRQPHQPLVLVGFSFGAYIAACAAKRLPANQGAHQLVLVGPSTQKQNMPDVPDDTLVIHGELDDIVPLQATLQWARAQTLPITVIPGVGHFFHGQLTLLKQLVLRHFKSFIDQEQP